jgi:hypothetical protein
MQERIDEIAEAWTNEDEITLHVLKEAFPVAVQMSSQDTNR